MDRGSGAPRAYRLLLRLLPEDLRDRFAKDMEDVFVHRLDRAGSPPGRLWVWLRAVLDVWAQAVAGRARVARGIRPGFDGLTHDVRLAGRSLASSPVLTSAALVTLALGVGASTATFSVVHAVFLERLPFADADRLVVVWPEVNANTVMTAMAEEQMGSLARVSGLSGWTLTLVGVGEPQEVTALQVSAHHFDLLGVRPALGRTFRPEEGLPGQAGVAVLSHEFWVRGFGADTSAVGRVIALGGAGYERREVIGVMPPDLEGVTQPTEVWIPLEADPTVSLEADDRWYVNVRVARLAAGATLEQASAEVLAYASAVQERLPNVFTREQAGSATVQPLRSYRAGDVGRALWFALFAVLLVLLIACANVANLLLARAESRWHDLGVRAALGAGRARIVRMLLAESGLLALAGGALGIGLSYLLMRVLVSQGTEALAGASSVSVNLPVLAFGLVATALATLLAGLLPALRAGRIDPAVTLGGSTRGHSARSHGRLTPFLVGSQICLAVLVTVGSGLMLRSLTNLIAVEPGLDGNGVLTFRPNPPASRYTNGIAFRDYYRSVAERLAALPTVEAVGAIHLLPGTTANWSFPTFPDGFERAEGASVPTINFRAIRGDYFDVVRMPLAAGRAFTTDDRAGTEPVVLVNRAFVERFWPGEDPLGRSVRLFSPTAESYRIVGVVADVRQHSRSADPRPEMYFSHEQVPWDQMTMWLTVRVSGSDPLDHARVVQEAVWSVDPSVPIAGLSDLATVLGQSTRSTRFLALLLSSFGALALVLGALGVFGVTTYTAGRSRPELGVRLALGSSRSRVLGLAARRSLTAIGAGLAAGLIGAAATSDLLESVLFGVEPDDPVTFLAVALLLGGVATSAALVPAWRACRVDLVSVLNGD